MNSLMKIGVTVILVSLTGCLPPYQPQTTNSTLPTDDRVTAEWRCKDYVSPGKVIVVAQILETLTPDQVENSGGIKGVGRIKAHGIIKDAIYYENGISHRWDFDPNKSENDLDASFLIEPDGMGKYFYFGSEKLAAPSLITKCWKSK